MFEIQYLKLFKMKSILKIRLLSILAFMLLIAPFYDSCNGDRMIKTSETVTETVTDSSNVAIDSSKIVLQDSVLKSIPKSSIEEKNVFC